MTKHKIGFSLALLAIISVARAQNIPSGAVSVAPLLQPVTTPGAYSVVSGNSIQVFLPIKPISSYADVVNSTNVNEVEHTAQFFDGFGRILQTVQFQGTPSKKDIVIPVKYDEHGRNSYEYLPYPSTGSTGKFRLDPFNEQKNFYTNPALNGNQYTGEQFFYSKTLFDNSPENREVKQLPEGNSWIGSNRGKTTSYDFNTIADAIRIWKVDNAAGSIPYSTGLYAANVLFKKEETSENGNRLIEFSDKDNKLILRKEQVANQPSAGYDGWICTYYVYDAFGSERCVIQPKGVDMMQVAGNWTLTTVILNEFCFLYDYDERDRMISKKEPGKAPIYMVYNKMDLLVMTQDGNLRSGNKWLVTKYDDLGRKLTTGLLNSTNDRAYHQGQVTANSGYPASLSEILTQTYYDNYNYANVKSFDNSDISKLTSTGTVWPDVVDKSNMTYGLETGSATNVLGSTRFLIKTIYYDVKGRSIQTLSDNNKSGQDISTNKMDFAGRVLSTYKKHTNPSSAISSTRILTSYEFDHRGQMIKTWKQLNDDGVNKLIVQQSYNQAGKLKTKKLDPDFNGGLGMESLDYKYNIRGWLSGINEGYATPSTSLSNWFGIKLNYDFGFTNSQYDGSISGVQWKSKGDGESRAYGFAYDGNRRLLKADFTQYTSSAWNTSASVNFSVLIGDGTNPYSAYDVNGNILAMKQWGLKVGSSAIIDDLIYKYIDDQSNRLLAVTESATINTSDFNLNDFTDKNRTADDYDYDNNGNVIYDKNKEISSITYNFLNLPESIVVTGKGTITYTYDANGNKLSKKVQDNTTNSPGISTTDYLEGAVYENNVLKMIGHEEGRMRWQPAMGANPAGFKYDYFIKDHLGNVRMVLSNEQKVDAYPAASMEDAQAATEELIYSNISTTRSPKPNGYPTDTYTNPNDKVAKLRGDNQKFGPSIVLKVMAGDKINLRANSWWNETGTAVHGASPLTQLALALASGVSGASAGKLSNVDISSGGADLLAATSFLNNRTYSSGKPKAYVNWILLDEQFKVVLTNDGKNTGYAQVGDNGVFSTHVKSDWELTKSGYLYVYVSNETENINVYFDNLQVTHIHGPLVEETHYYPFGLTMKGISSEGLGGYRNKTKFNSKDLQDREFSDGKGLEWYDYGARTQDPQIGRWYGIDPLSAKFGGVSPYAYVLNNPVNNIDPDGKDVIFITDASAVPLPIGVNAGHGAVIIGNAKDGYYYYSMNGTGEGTRMVGDSKNADVGTRLKSTSVEDAIKEANSVNKDEKHDYTKFVRVKSTTEEDNAMKQAAGVCSKAKKYVFIGSSCIDVQKAAYNTLVQGRVGSIHRRIDWQLERLDAPNAWIRTLPQTFKALNDYMKDRTDNRNYFVSSKIIRTIIYALPVIDISKEFR